MDFSNILGTLTSLIPVDQITEFLNGIATKVPELAGVISTITGFISSIGA